MNVEREQENHRSQILVDDCLRFSEFLTTQSVDPVASETSIVTFKNI